MEDRSGQTWIDSDLLTDALRWASMPIGEDEPVEQKLEASDGQSDTEGKDWISVSNFMFIAILIRSTSAISKTPANDRLSGW